MTVSPRGVVVSLVVGLCVGPAGADEKSDAAARQKSAARARLDVAKLKLTEAETDDLLLYAPVPAERMKSAATTIQKCYGTAARALGYDAKETPWTGKLTVFVVAGSRTYRTFVLDALKKLPDGNELAALELRSDAPFVVVGIDSEKPADSRVATEASIQVAAALASRKAGVGRSAITFGLPAWLRSGFGRAVFLRSDGRGSKQADHKQQVKALFNRTRGTAFQTAAVWGDAVNPQSELLTVSLVEYLAFGPAAEKFPALLAGFKPADEDAPAPTISTVLASLEWKVEDLEAGWRKWVLTGK
jgi:hypothetical protein